MILVHSRIRRKLIGSTRRTVECPLGPRYRELERLPAIHLQRYEIAHLGGLEQCGIGLTIRQIQDVVRISSPYPNGLVAAGGRLPIWEYVTPGLDHEFRPGELQFNWGAGYYSLFTGLCNGSASGQISCARDARRSRRH